MMPVKDWVLQQLGVKPAHPPDTTDYKKLTYKSDKVEAYFSPRGGVADAVCKELAKAESEVLVQAYYLTSSRIIPALNMWMRVPSMSLRVIIDGKETPSNKLTSLVAPLGKGQVRLDYAHNIAHNKIIIIDQKTLLTGSYNWTDTAESANAENLLIIRDPQLALAYRADFEAHWLHSVDWKT